ncbi:UDP-N-acetylmuramoyl-L-alanyl-D-glutamate--2,6-diaminopimelate ligase, partial [bacterium]|nr:UDP-N-acetylmuramoyl-L-alanyl-D-glutamate--2,6-diaminopimelate ligase [bacterium]
MQLREIASLVNGQLYAGHDVEIERITLDSRNVRPGSLFAAVVDPMRNGEHYIEHALDAGAEAVLAAREVETYGRPILVVDDVREALAKTAHMLTGHPTHDMLLVGITGTNGKTSLAYLLEAILTAAGHSVGVIGTVTHRFAGKVIPAANTTPEAPDLADLLWAMKDAEVSAVVMEVSSHALALSRVTGCEFNAAIFTNLTRDHIDFHLDMDRYATAKARLFSEHLTDDPNLAVVNWDDEYCNEVLRAAGGKFVQTYGMSEGTDFHIVDAVADRKGVRLRLTTPEGDLEFASTLLGPFQAYNIAAAAATALNLGVAPDTIVQAVRNFRAVPGRMEPVPDPDVTVLVDYAHTPDALVNVVGAARALTEGRLFTVFGCGGDRDRGKRPMMAKAAATESDICVVTSDNPRTEKADEIIEDVLNGLNLVGMDRLDASTLAAYRGNNGFVVEPDRRKAIAMAIAAAQAGDLVLIAGKGHEDYQIIGREKIHLDDREEAAAALAARRVMGGRS